MKCRLETLANAFTVVAVLVFLLFVARTWTGGSAIRSEPRHVRAGDRLPDLPGYSWTSADATLLIAIRCGCEYCDRSVPFYARLGAQQREGRSKAHLVLTTPDDGSCLDVARLGAGVQMIRHVDLSSLKITSTPTLVFVGRDRFVRRVWIGQLPTKNEDEVSNILAAGYRK